MSRTNFIASIALALAGCGSVPEYSKLNHVTQLPAPIAADGEPAIITTKIGTQGKWKVYTQTFPDAGTFAVTPPNARIASLYNSFNGRTQDLMATNVPVLCDISADGTVTLHSCDARTQLTEDQDLALRLARSGSNGVGFPRFRVLPQDRESISREVPMTLEVPAVKAPLVDLSSGPLVEPRLIDIKLNPNALSSAYPSRALRQEIEGNLKVECQVQSDLSVICTPLSFDPPEHFELFRRAANQIFRSTRPEPLLKDGSDARGVRWQSTLAFRIPG